MGDGPKFDDITGEADPVDDTTTRKVQQLGRVDVPDDYLSQIGVGEGDKVFVVCKEEEVRIVKADPSKIL